ncbi:MAG TPA: metallophosphoesterase [Phycisphaerae bacterium]|nr:metallophosphoesterase [Phycisphaerae bacterium]
MRCKLARMRIGVLSDTHDRLPAIDAALAVCAREGVEAILHPGDLVAPFAAKRLLGWKGPLFVTYGNNDGERKGLRSILPQIQDGPVFIELAGKRILLHHDLARCKPADLAKAQIVVTGHTHEVVNEVHEGQLVLNPGECCGWVSGRSTVAVLDTDAFSANIVELTL